MTFSLLPRLSALAAVVLICGCTKSETKPTATSRQPVVHEYHGLKVTNDYEWLENAANPAVRRWAEAQNTQARSHLDPIPERALVKSDLERLFENASPNYSTLSWRAGRLFLLKFQPPAQQPVLITLESAGDLKSEKVILDPNTLDAQGSKTIDWFVPSPDGKRVAVSMSEGGSEDGTLHFFETDTGRALPDLLLRVQYPTGGGSAAWNADGSGIFYTRYPAPGERPDADLHFHQQIYFHQLGTPAAQDRLEFGKDWPRIAEIDLESSVDGKHLLASVQNGDGGEFAHYLRTPRGEWQQITRFEDGVKQAEFGRDPLSIELGRNDSIYLLSTKDAPMGNILRVKLARPDLAAASVVIKEGTNSLHHFKPTASGVALAYVKGGPMEFVYKDFFNRDLSGPSSRSTNPDFKVPHSVDQMLVTRGDEILFRSESYTEPFTWWKYDTNKDRDKPEATALRGKSPVPFADVEAVRVKVASKDKTSVPMTILRRKGTRVNGTSPAILTGYGGYGISRTPRFDFTSRVWFDQGGILAIANLRGGSEFGEPWRGAGNLTHKQNVFDDFAACAEFLVRSNHTTPARLALEGRSNGGLLMGATLTQRPELAAAVVSHVGVYDLLRAELDPNGAFNTTEYGSVKDAAQFQALRAYSPYHNVRDQENYPAVLMLTGANDGRVNPAHSRKMAARLQAATGSKHPVLLGTSSTSGHGLGTALNERVEQLADVYAFLLTQLGVNYSQVERGPWSGGVTPTSAMVKGKVARAGLSVQLAVSRSEDMKGAALTKAVISDTNENNVVAFKTEGLKPDTQYYYALVVNKHVDLKTRGAFKTFPAAGPASFQIAFASCGRTGSTRDVFDRIREHRPLFYMNMGDFHYLDIKTNNRTLFRGGYDQVLASPQQGDLYRALPFIYMWDDHDYGGNDATKKSPTHIAARRTYEEYVPHYPFGDADEDESIYQTFTVGRVKFILTDLRSGRDEPKKKDDAQKSMMGVKQKQWFKDELLAANGKYPLICWVSSVPWIGERGKSPYRSVRTNEWGYLHHTNLVRRTNTVGTVAEEEAAAKSNAVANAAAAAVEGDEGDETAKPTEVARATNTTSTVTNTANAGGGRGRGRGRGPGGASGTNNPNGGGGDEDHWSAYTTERREIADFIKANQISGVCILHGDSHMLAADNGANSDYATGGGAPIPVMCGGPLDQNPSLKGGPYSQGVYRVRDKEGESGFGLLTVTDQGGAIEVVYSGRNNKDEEKVSLKFTVPAVPEKVARRKL